MLLLFLRDSFLLSRDFAHENIMRNEMTSCVLFMQFTSTVRAMYGRLSQQSALFYYC